MRRAERMRLLKKYERKIIEINHNRVTVILILLYFVEWIIYFESRRWIDISNIVLIFQLYLTFIIPIMIITKIKFEQIPLGIHKFLLLVNILAVIFFSMGLVFFTLDQGNTIHIFTMVIMGIAAVVYMPIKVSAPIIILSTVFFCVGVCRISQDNMHYVFSFNTILFNSIALVLSVNLFSMKNKEFMNIDKLAEQNSTLEKKAKHDQMTNLLNHEAILNILAKEMFFKDKYAEDLIVLLLDIDDFKKINDSFGHSEGDKVIKMIAGFLKKAVRSTDYVGRYGGEEFLVVMPKSSVEGAHSVYERFRDMLSEKYSCKGYQITVSCGMARCENEQTINELINLADNRLYMAKQTGKDKCVYQ